MPSEFTRLEAAAWARCSSASKFVMKKGGKIKWDRRDRFRKFRASTDRQSLPNSHKNWRDQIEASYKSKEEFVRREVGNLGETVLDEAVWSRGLPDDVFCTVLACLPLSSFFRLRCVCKKWSLIAQDRIFLNACTRVSSQEPSIFFTSRDGAYWVYEYALNSWRCMPPSFFYPKQSEGRCSLVTAAGSRLLFVRNSPQYSLMVYNPLNDTQQALPPMFDMSGNFGLPSASEIHVVGMYVDTVKKYYNILVADKRTNKMNEDSYDSEDDEFELEAITSQVYDSRTSAWDLIESFEPTYELRMLNAALFADALHCLTIAPQLSRVLWDRPVVDELAVYKILPDGWEQETLRVPTQDQALVAPHIFSTRGRPMLAAAVPFRRTTRIEAFPNWKSIVIWELEMVDNVEDKWVKMAEIELHGLDPGLFKVSLDSFIFLSEGDSLYFGSNTGSSLGIINMQAKTWRLLPSFPGYVSQRGTPAKKFMTFVYQPRFDLVA